jgi:hypothetical protein
MCVCVCGVLQRCKSSCSATHLHVKERGAESKIHSRTILRWEMISCNNVQERCDLNLIRQVYSRKMHVTCVCERERDRVCMCVCGSSSYFITINE